MTKMFRHAKRFGMVAMAILLSGVLLLGSVVPAKAEPGEERVVKIGFRTAFTGVVATTGVVLYEGAKNYLKYVNDRGGIDGIKLIPIWEEGAGLVPREITGHKRLVEKGIVAEFSWIQDAVEIMAPRQQKSSCQMLWKFGSVSI